MSGAELLLAPEDGITEEQECQKEDIRLKVARFEPEKGCCCKPSGAILVDIGADHAGLAG